MGKEGVGQLFRILIGVRVKDKWKEMRELTEILGRKGSIKCDGRKNNSVRGVTEYYLEQLVLSNVPVNLHLRQMCSSIWCNHDHI